MFSSRLLPLLALAWPVAAAESPFEVAPGADKPAGSFEPPTTAHELRLTGARNEVLPFLLKLPAGECQVLRLQGAKALPFLKLFAMPAFRTSQASFRGATVGRHYDPLVELADRKLCPAADAKHTWFWGEISVPRDFPAGEHEFRLENPHHAGMRLRLKVWPLRLPEEATLPIYSVNTPWGNLLGHYGRWDESEATLDLAYRALIREHRISLLSSWIARPSFRTTPKGKAAALELGAEAFSPSAAKSRQIDYPGFDPQKPEAENERYFRALQRDLVRAPRAGRALQYLWDEPKPEEFPELLRRLQKIRSWAPGLKLMVTSRLRPEFESTVDVLTVPLDEFEAKGFPAPDEYARFRAKPGRELWFYVSCMSHSCTEAGDSGRPDLVIDRPAAWVRSVGWIARRFRFDAFFYYSLNYAYQFYPKRDPWTDQWAFTGNGDGTLLYPLRPGEHGAHAHGPAPSIRLKLLRQASTDAEYVHWMDEAKRKADWWPAELRRLVPDSTRWSRSSADYEKLREKIGDFLSEKLSADATKPH